MTAQSKVEAAADPLSTSEMIECASEGHAFAWNGITICETIESAAEALELAPADWQIEAIRGRARRISALARVAVDQMRRAVDHLQPILDRLPIDGAA